MTAPLLFCIAEEAKPLVREVMQDVKNGDDSIFYLVESHADPSSDESFKRQLQDDEIFETDFIGVSEQECQKWALEKQYQKNFIDQDILAIADKRSANDNTLLIQFYSQRPAIEYGRYGVLPKERNVWHNFRIDYKKAWEVYCALQYGPTDFAHIVYFAHKEELTNEAGIFDVEKAQRLMNGEDPEMLNYA